MTLSVSLRTVHQPVDRGVLSLVLPHLQKPSVTRAFPDSGSSAAGSCRFRTEWIEDPSPTVFHLVLHQEGIFPPRASFCRTDLGQGAGGGRAIVCLTLQGPPLPLGCLHVHPFLLKQGMKTWGMNSDPHCVLLGEPHAPNSLRVSRVHAVAKMAGLTGPRSFL